MQIATQSLIELPGVKKLRSGKVREVFDLDDTLLFVVSDRISAFDVIMPNGIPDKGRILNALTLFWFEKFGRQFEHHLITARFKDYPKELQKFSEQLQGRSMLVKKAQVVPIECVARGYLAGSGWKEYHRSHTVCGIPLPHGLRQSDKLPAPIFTPATKEETGHDVNIAFDEMARRVGSETATQLRDRTLALWTLVSALAIATHYFAAFVVAPEAVWLVLRARDRRRGRLLGHPGRSVLHAALAVRWRDRRRPPPPSLCSSVLVRGTDASLPPAGVDFGLQQGKQHLAAAGADSAQNRHACSDFLANEESGNAQAVDHRA